MGSVVFEVLRPVLPVEDFSSVIVCCRVIAVSLGCFWVWSTWGWFF